MSEKSVVVINNEKFLRFLCKFCYKTFERKEDLIDHVSEDHESIEKSFTCHLCHQKFILKQNLNAHIFYMHGKEAKTYPSFLCENSFTADSDLKKHMDRIPPEKRNWKVKCESLYERRKFPCEMCNTKFSHQLSLDRHIRKFHRKEKKINYECQSCGDILPSHACFMEHVNFMHLNVTISPLDKKSSLILISDKSSPSSSGQ